MSKVDKPPVDVRHECAYIEEIGKKLEARGWTYAKKYDFYRNEDKTAAYLPRPASFEPALGFSFDEYEEYFKLAKLPYKGNWELVKTLSYEKYGISVDYIVEIIRALFGGFSAKVMGSTVIGFLPKMNPAIVFVPYKDDYAIFLIAPLRYENGGSIEFETKIHEDYPYSEPEHIFYDLYNQVIGPYHEGKIIPLEEFKAKWERAYEESLKQRVDTLIRYHFGGYGARMYALSGYLTILKDPAFSEEEKESAKKNVPETFAWIKRKYDQIPFSELSKSPFYDDLKPLFEINKLLSALEEELEREPLDLDKIESIMSSLRELGKEYGEIVDKYYEELTGKDLGAATVETRALMEYRSKEQIEDQARWLKEQGIEPNSFEKAAMEYYGVEIPEEKPLISEAKAAITECDKGFETCLEFCDDDLEVCYEACVEAEDVVECNKKCEKKRDKCHDKCEADAGECYDDSAREIIEEDIEEGDLTKAEEDLETFMDYISDELYEELDKRIKRKLEERKKIEVAKPPVELEIPPELEKLAEWARKFPTAEDFKVSVKKYVGDLYVGGTIPVASVGELSNILKKHKFIKKGRYADYESFWEVAQEVKPKVIPKVIPKVKPETPEERLRRMQEKGEAIAKYIKPPYHVVKVEYGSIHYESPYHEGIIVALDLEQPELIQKILDDFTDAIRITQGILRTSPNIRKFYGFKLTELEANDNFLRPYTNIIVDIKPVKEYFGWGTSSIGERGIKIYWHSPELTKEIIKESLPHIEATPPATTAHEMEHTLGSRKEITNPLGKIVGLMFYLRHPEYVPEIPDFDWICFEMSYVFRAYLRKDRPGIAREQINALYSIAPERVNSCLKKQVSEAEIVKIKEIIKPPEEDLEAVKEEIVKRIEEHEKTREYEIKELLDSFISLHEKMDYPEEFLTHIEEGFSLIADLPLKDLEYYEKKLTAMIKRAKELLAIPERAPPKFKPGDRVSYMGRTGKIIECTRDYEERCFVKFDDGYDSWMYAKNLEKI